MARLVKRGNSQQYEISYKRDDGKYTKIGKSGFKTKGEAKDAANELGYSLNKDLRGDRKNLLLSDYFRDWMQLYKEGTVSPIIYRKYENTLMNIKKYVPAVLISDLDRVGYQRFLSKYAKDHVKSTVIKFNNHVRTSLKDTIEEGLIPFDPTRKVVVKEKGPLRPKKNKYLDYDQFKSLMKLVEENLSAQCSSSMLVLVAGAAGMRFAELLGLTWEDIDFEGQIITISKTWSYKLNEWGKTKNGTSNRKISINKHTIDLLKKFKINQKKLFENFEIKNPHNFVFFNLKNGLVSSNAVSKYLHKELKELRIEKQFTLHGLRHTHASILLYQGINIFNVSKHLGRNSLETTMSTYLHIVQELEDQGKGKVSTMFDGLYKNDN